jgi:hypothetical protein
MFGVGGVFGFIFIKIFSMSVALEYKNQYMDANYTHVCRI